MAEFIAAFSQILIAIRDAILAVAMAWTGFGDVEEASVQPTAPALSPASQSPCDTLPTVFRS